MKEHRHQARHDAWPTWRVTLPALALLAATAVQGAALPAVQSGKVIVLPQGEPVRVSDFVGKDDAPPLEGTTVTLRWDDHALEAVFDCTDSAIAAQVAKDRDNAKTWKDDSVGVLLDLGHGHDPNSGTVALLLSAAGGLYDRRGRDVGYTCEGIESTVEQVDGGWRATIRAPWAGLWTRPKAGDVWGLNLTRIDHEGRTYANMKHMAWSPFTEHPEEIDHWGHVIFAPKGAKTDDPLVAAAHARVGKTHAARLASHYAPQRDCVLLLPKGKPSTVDTFVAQRSGAPARQPTTATLAWDDQGLTFVFDCTDPAIAAAHPERDDIKLWKDDCATAWLDPGHTHNTAGRLIMLQVGASGAFHDARDGDMGYNVAGAQTEVIRTEAGWRAQLRLPWAGLGVAPPKPGDAWGMNLTRVDQPGVYDADRTEYTTWAPLNADFARIDQWGHILFAGPDAQPDDDPVRAARTAIDAAHTARERIIAGIAE